MTKQRILRRRLLPPIRLAAWFALAAIVLGLGGGALDAQRPGTKPKKKEVEPPPARPTDPKLIELHKEFLAGAEKLASEYERKNELDKAREVYQAILRLVPKYSRAEQSLDRITEREATADRKMVTVKAKEGWQDSGIVLVEGKPVTIEAKGAWTFRMEHRLDANGIEIPKELRDFNLGALIGAIVTGPDREQFKPFLIGTRKQFIANRTGKLLLRMYDASPEDNAGEMSVSVQSTFGKAKKQ